jgi:hypothetical protein
MSEELPDRLPEEVSLRLRWVGTEEVPIQFVNRFTGQPGELGEVVVILGQAALPPFLGTPEQQAEQARQVEYVPIKTIARIALTRTGAEQLATMLRTIAQALAQEQQVTRGDENAT